MRSIRIYIPGPEWAEAKMGYPCKKALTNPFVGNIIEMTSTGIGILTPPISVIFN
jgi:hypothetical protein